MTLFTKSGVSLIISSLSVWIIDRLFHNTISNRLGKWLCGDEFLIDNGNGLGDSTCGINADIYLTAVLALVFLVGVALTLATTVLFRSPSFR